MDPIQAVKARDKLALASSLKGGGDPNTADPHGMTALMHAVDLKNIELVKMLLEAKADVNCQDQFGQTAVMLAAGRNFLGAVKQLIAAKADLTKVSKSRLTALGFATDNGHSEAAKLIRNAGGK
jgi:ankyrin repeat protein